MKNANCPCPNTTCPRHGDCEACNTHHDGNGFCKREENKTA